VAARSPANPYAQAGVDTAAGDLAVELMKSAEGAELSEYHLQAGIAAIHCTAADAASTDWRHILRHYDDLLRIKYSPIVGLNRAVAVAHVEGPRAALEAIAALPERALLEKHYLFHAVTGELHWRLQEFEPAASAFRRALALAHVGPEQAYIGRMLGRAAQHAAI